MNRYKNKNYKSSVQTYNGATQDILATDTVLNPVNVLVGGTITDTGCAIRKDVSGFDVECSGLYRISFDADLTATTAGAVTIALVINGIVAPETVKTNTVAAAGEEQVSAETVRALYICGALSDYNIGVIAYSDGTFVGSVDNISANIIKLA